MSAGKRSSYLKYGGQAFAFFTVAHSAVLVWQNGPPSDWTAFILAIVEWGLLGMAIVLLLVWLTNWRMARR